jgi:DNA-binding response OmpR family regulator
VSSRSDRLPTTVVGVTRVLIASDAPQVAAQIQSVFPSSKYDVQLVSNGPDVRESCEAIPPDLVILDFQIGNMGGMAICLDLRLEASGGRLPEIPVLLLLDRRADVFLARRAGAQGWLVKPLDPIRLRKASEALLTGESYHDASFLPDPVIAV